MPAKNYRNLNDKKMTKKWQKKTIANLVVNTFWNQLQKQNKQLIWFITAYVAKGLYFALVLGK